jgi:hypothetical protein
LPLPQQRAVPDPPHPHPPVRPAEGDELAGGVDRDREDVRSLLRKPPEHLTRGPVPHDRAAPAAPDDPGAVGRDRDRQEQPVEPAERDGGRRRVRPTDDDALPGRRRDHATVRRARERRHRRASYRPSIRVVPAAVEDRDAALVVPAAVEDLLVRRAEERVHRDIEAPENPTDAGSGFPQPPVPDTTGRSRGDGQGPFRRDRHAADVIRDVLAQHLPGPGVPLLENAPSAGHEDRAVCGEGERAEPSVGVSARRADPA